MAENEIPFVIARGQAASEIVHPNGCSLVAPFIADRCECTKSIRTVIPVLRAEDQALGYVEMITGPGGMSTLTAYGRPSSEPSIRLGEHDSVVDAAHAIYDDTVKAGRAGRRLAATLRRARQDHHARCPPAVRRHRAGRSGRADHRAPVHRRPSPHRVGPAAPSTRLLRSPAAGLLATSPCSTPR